MFLEKQQRIIKNGDQWSVKDSTWMHRNSVIQALDNILVIVEESLFFLIVRLMLGDLIIWTLWKHYNAAE